ncbi:MAG: PA0069 family radical SAM protein [Aurantimonas coralicida]|jgi:DNA repair photolyase|uniref:PA0069 family radical SAM protein n=1 Tax=Aurantimonas TaxID=182269 RepID=UPI00042858D8|nr:MULTISPECIES: PA0069 family radical SAM protein [Aurantimonas]MBC6717064.1 PA0069 family radical SAM protein [Aurantimonas sp. DM33-3]MCD1641810.1 PA0069 family radical SAM protein [Aurantimonas coralicida]MCW7542752.1 PA0069 family radical SAM protein [Aurantimonas litoralis]MDE0922599.1 PA0069 family radical SAM protein [Aurantimonas coralicida]
MQDIAKADQAAFSAPDGVDIANHIIGEAGLRIGFERRRGRGAGLNPSGRFEPFKRQAVDDGWNTLDELPAFKTDVQVEKPKTIISRNTSPDISFDRSINPYRGCEHGCVYCFARPSHAYMGLSAGLDFESKLFAKPNAAELLERELSKPGYQVKSIAIGTNTDPYQPIEKSWRVMREILEVLEAANHPVGIVTKSALVLRDIDILSRMAAKGLAKVALSVTTLDRTLARAMEPRAATPTKRLEAVKALSEAGVPTMVMTAPIIPGLTDSEIERLLEAAQTAGAREVGYVLLRMPLEVSPLFKDWLLRHYPNRYRHVLSLLRSMRDGKDYDAEWGKRMRGTGPYAFQIRRRFEMAARRLGLNESRTQLRCDLFTPPRGAGVQLALL